MLWGSAALNYGWGEKRSWTVSQNKIHTNTQRCLIINDFKYGGWGAENAPPPTLWKPRQRRKVSHVSSSAQLGEQGHPVKVVAATSTSVMHCRRLLHVLSLHTPHTFSVLFFFYCPPPAALPFSSSYRWPALEPASHHQWMLVDIKHWFHTSSFSVSGSAWTVIS